MIPLAPIVGVGVRAVATVVVSVTLVRPAALDADDLVPGALVTVWEDDAGRHVLVEPLGEDDTGTPTLAEVRAWPSR